MANSLPFPKWFREYERINFDYVLLSGARNGIQSQWSMLLVHCPVFRCIDTSMKWVNVKALKIGARWKHHWHRTYTRTTRRRKLKCKGLSNRYQKPHSHFYKCSKSFCEGYSRSNHSFQSYRSTKKHDGQTHSDMFSIKLNWQERSSPITIARFHIGRRLERRCKTGCAIHTMKHWLL